MKKIYYIYVCLGVLLLTALPAKAASEAEFGKLAKTYTLHKDGSQEMRVYKELTLFTHAAMNGLYGESFIVYNPAYQELKIHESYTRQKDGKIVKTPENAFVEVLPAAAADLGTYGTGVGSDYLFGLLGYHTSRLFARAGCICAGRGVIARQRIYL